MAKVELAGAVGSMSISLTDKLYYPDKDFVRLVYNRAEQKLYGWNYLDGAIYCATWAGWTAALPAAWTLVVANGSLSGQCRSPFLTIYESADAGAALGADFGRGPRSVAGIVLADRSHLAHQWAYDMGTSMYAEQIFSCDGVVADRSRLHCPGTWTASQLAPWQLSYTGTGARTAGIYDLESGAAIVSGVTVDAVGVQIGPFAEFQSDPGRVYRLRDDTGAAHAAWGTVFQSYVRYGQPLASPELTLGWGIMDYLGPDIYYESIAGGKWGVGTEVVSRSPSGPCVVLLWLAARRPDGSDPVSYAGSTAVLQPDAEMSWAGDLGGLKDSISHDVAFFNEDEQWADTVILVQYAFATSGGVGVSDVFGRRIRKRFGAQAQAQAVMGGSGPSGQAAPNNGRADAAREMARLCGRPTMRTRDMRRALGL